MTTLSTRSPHNPSGREFHMPSVQEVEMLGRGHTGRGCDQGVWGGGAASCCPSPVVRLAPGFQALSTEEPKAVGLVEFLGDLLQFILIGDAL